MNDQKIELTLPLVNAILQYLGSRPFVEVAGLINEIQKQAAAQGEASVEQPKAED